MHHRSIQIVIEFGIAHQQSQRAIVAVQLGRHLLHILKGIVNSGHRSGQIELAQIMCQGVGIGKRTIGILQHRRHLTVQAGGECVQLIGGSGQITCNRINMMQ